MATLNAQATYNLKTAEAIERIRTAKRGTKFALSIRNPAPIVDTNNEFPAGLSTWLDLTRAQALQLAGNMLSPTLEERGGRIPLRVRETEYGVTYWIGA